MKPDRNPDEPTSRCPECGKIEGCECEPSTETYAQRIAEEKGETEGERDRSE